MLSDGGDQLASARPEPGGNLTQGIQNVFFARGLRLLLKDDVSGAAVLGP